MKAGILITARLGSTRLGKKHLLPVNSQPLLYYLIKRITWEFEKELLDNRVQLIIATSDEPENRKFEDFSKYGTSVFYGSINNIPMRHSQTAEFHNLDAVVSIDGDDILCSPKGMREVYKALNKNAQYVKTTNLPFGMNSMGYSRSFLESSVNTHRNDTLETGWGRIFDTSMLKTIEMGLTEDERLRFTLDYEEDYQFFSRIIELLGDAVYTATDQEILDLVFKDDLWRLNVNVCREYWQNFYKQRDQEAH